MNCHSITMVFNHVADALGLDPIEVAIKNNGAEGHDINWLNEQRQRWDSLSETACKNASRREKQP